MKRDEKPSLLQHSAVSRGGKNEALFGPGSVTLRRNSLQGGEWQFAGVGVGRHENTRLSTAEARMASEGGRGGTRRLRELREGPEAFPVLSKGLPGAFYIRKGRTDGPVCFPDPSFSSTLGSILITSTVL